MNKSFNRGLSKECIDALKRLAREPGDEWWKEVLANKDFLLAVRGGYLNAYAKGQFIFKIGPKVVGGGPRIKPHYKYLLEPEPERSPHAQFTRKSKDEMMRLYGQECGPIFIRKRRRSSYRGQRAEGRGFATRIHSQW